MMPRVGLSPWSSAEGNEKKKETERKGGQGDEEQVDEKGLRRVTADSILMLASSSLLLLDFQMDHQVRMAR